MKIKLTLTIILLIIINNKILSQDIKVPIAELIVNSTIRIECNFDSIINGKKETFTSTGTGFYFEFLIDSLRVPVIVTNYHVIRNSNFGTLNFTEQVNKTPKYGSMITEKFVNFRNMWIKHPNVDLAILPVNPIVENIIKIKKKIPFTICFPEELLPTKILLDQITAIEEVFMIGYPKGLWDKTNNLPIVRKGITATPVYLNYEGKKQFLLDIPNFPGSSGSPIVLFNQGSYSTNKGGIVVGGRLVLLGINVQAYNYEAESKSQTPNDISTNTTTTTIPLNIAKIIKSEELLGFKPILKNLIYSNKK